MDNFFGIRAPSPEMLFKISGLTAPRGHSAPAYATTHATKYPFNRLRVGDSLYIPTNRYRQCVIEGMPDIRQVKEAARLIAKRHGKVFVWAKHSGFIECYRFF